MHDHRARAFVEALRQATTRRAALSRRAADCEENVNACRFGLLGRRDRDPQDDAAGSRDCRYDGPMPATSERSRVRSVRALWALLAAVAVWHLVALAYIVATRVTFPFDIDWLDGGSLYQAHRIAHGERLYTVGDAGFVPYPYPPLYFAMLAGIGKVTGRIDYAGARLLSILAFAGVAFAAVRVVYVHATALRCPPRQAALIALATAALIASGYPSTFGAYDGVRPDALAAAFAGGAVILACLPTASGSALGPRHALAAALLMTLALFTKQTHVVLALALGVLFFMRSRALGFFYAATLGTLSLGGFLALERATSGAFSSWLFSVRHHSFDAVKLAEGAQRLVFGAPHLVVIALVATTHWRALSPRSRAWVVASASALPAAIVPYAKAWGAPNNFVPVLLLAAPTAAFVLLDVLTSSYRRLGVPIFAAMFGGLLAGKVYEGDAFRPTKQMQEYARALVVKIAALDGDVLCPIHTYLPIAAGHYEEQAHLLSYLDAEAARMPHVSADAFVAYVRARKPRWIVVGTSLEEDVLRAVLAEDYTVASSIEVPKTNEVFLSFPRRVYERKASP